MAKDRYDDRPRPAFFTSNATCITLQRQGDRSRVAHIASDSFFDTGHTTGVAERVRRVTNHFTPRRQIT